MEQIGKYKVLTHIGHGAMGSVEKAEAPDGTIVAIKTLFPQFAYEEEYVKRFKREAELAKKLSHPNVVKIIEIGEDQEGRRQYIVMEYIDGKTLAECMHDKGMASAAIKRSSKLNEKDKTDSKDKKTPKTPPVVTTFSAEETIKIIRQLAGVLQAAGDIGLLHRDVKPQNILLDKKGNAKLLDFGLAKDTEALVSMLSMTGQSIGTPPYMSPEQHDGQKDIDLRSDLYSLGCTAYHMLTGKAPFPGPTASAFARQHCDDIPRTSPQNQP
jgi:eukaryotic-like serine/threonine-protein kinase